MINSPLKATDTVAPIEFFAKNGYYVVGKKIFNHKILAMQEATRLQLGPVDVQWVFNDEAFDGIDWTIPLDIPLNELYRSRAQQLRQKYDYLILMFSGGADSTTMLESFVLNNINLDEVVVTWPCKQTFGRYVPNKKTDATNINSEWDFVIQPKLKWLEKNYPKVKITILDILSQPDFNEDREDTVLITEKHTYPNIQRYRSVDNLLLQRQKKHHNIATMLGVGPVYLVIVGDYLFMHFDDSQNPGVKSDFTASGVRRNIEYFYWTPDMPEIPREQAHVILAHLNLCPEDRQFIQHWSIDEKRKLQGSRIDFEKLRRFRKPLLYPNFDPDTFQVNKPKDSHYKPEFFQWFLGNKESIKIIEPWQSNITSHQRLIDPAFFMITDGVITDYWPYWSKFRKIGRLHDYHSRRTSHG